MGNTASDYFNNDVTFIHKSSTGNMYLANSRKSYFAKKLTVNCSGSTITFGNGTGGKAVFNGNTDQSITTTSGNPNFKRVEVNKSSGKLFLLSSISISDSLIITKGILKTDNTNILSLTDNVILIGGSDTSFIFGPMKKVGNDAFTFPLGDTSLIHPYHPISIDAPNSSSDTYIANYISNRQTLGELIDTTIEHLSSCQYWILNRISGNSKVRVSLNWNYDSCEYSIISPEFMRVAGFNGTVWKDLGYSTYNGDSIKGSTTSFDSVSTTTVFTISNLRCKYFNNYLTSSDILCNGGADGSALATVLGGTKPYTYLWSDGKGADKKAINLYNKNYSV
jgi:hypothetical protein